MELYQLKCFLAIVDEGGFNRATTRLHITQPALSYQIKQLEQELGVTLFHRRPRGVSPTNVGRVLHQHAQEIMECVRKARRAVEAQTEGVAGEIRIGTVNSVGIYLLPPVLQKMREKFPKARPTVLYRNSNEIMEALLSNKVDLALVANPRPDRRLQQETIVTEQISLVCGRSHQFFGRTSVKPAELNGLPFVSLTPENPTGQLIRELLAKLGVNIELVVSTDNVETVKKMVEVGLGLGFLPNMVTAPYISCNKKIKGSLARIEVGPPLTRRIVLVSWKNYKMSPASKALIEELRLHGSQWKECI
jgi:DNA-binding transcriptional LysR family regulator